jgi:2-iminobutanoate/2-iminopropanoate deaminase
VVARALLGNPLETCRGDINGFGIELRERSEIVTKETFRVPGVSDATDAAGVPLSAAVKGAGLVFVSGMPPIDTENMQLVSGDIARQAELCLDNVKAALEAAGSSMDKVLKVTVYASNSAYYSTINAVYARYFPENPPARTFVTVASWPMEFDIEIECTALA